MVELVTDRLRLRPFLPEDLPAFVAYRRDAEIARYQSWDSSYSLADAERFLAAQRDVEFGAPGQWVQLAAVDRHSGTLCGDCAVRVLDTQPATAEIGVTFAAAHQGSGLAAEALSAVVTALFVEHGLHRVYAETDDRNVAVHRLFERLGFRCEARLVEADWFKGEWSTLRVFAVLRREWVDRRPTAERPSGPLPRAAGGNRLGSVATAAHLGSEVTGHAPAPSVAGARARRSVPRVFVVGAPVVYVAALVAFVLSWGLPLARDQLFLWLLLGLAAFSVGAWRSWGAMLLAWLPWLGLLVVYDELRGAVTVLAADAHVAPQIAFDRWLGAGVTPTEWLQRELWSPGHLHWYDIAVWAVYLTHFFAVWLVAAMLWRRSRDRFGRYAVLTIVLTLAAFLVYWRFPAQPPWLASDLGHLGPVDRIVPSVWDRLGVSSMQSVYENSNLVNTVAAMPSLHAAYPFMLLLFFWPAGWAVRAALGAYTLAMAFALVYGGEHFVVDILAGWVLAAVAFAAVAAVAAVRAWRVRSAAGNDGRSHATVPRIAAHRDSGGPAISERVV